MALGRTMGLTAGRQTSVIIETRDKYGNLADDQSTMLVVTGRHEKEGVRHSDAVAARVDAGQFQASLVAHTVSGLLSLSSSLVHCSGIHATYSNAPDLDPATAVKATQAPGIDFSAQAGMTPPDSSLLAADPYSIRWAGMLHPLHAQQYTLYATRQAEKERVKMWVDNVLVIDMWSSLKSGNEVSGTIGFGAAEGHVYEIIVEYRSGSAGKFSAHVKVAGNDVIGSPQSVQVVAGKPSPSSWRYSGEALTLSSAGILSSFRVFSADEHGNTVSNAEIEFSGLYAVKSTCLSITSMQTCLAGMPWSSSIDSMRALLGSSWSGPPLPSQGLLYSRIIFIKPMPCKAFRYQW